MKLFKILCILFSLLAFIGTSVKAEPLLKQMLVEQCDLNDSSVIIEDDRERYLIEYNAHGDTTEYLRQNYDPDTDKWVNGYRFAFKYENGLLAERNVEKANKSNPSEWVVDEKIVYTYYNNGLLKEEKRTITGFSQTTTYTYNSSNLLVEKTATSDFGTEAFFYKYNSNKQLVADSTNSYGRLSQKHLYSYTTSGKLREKIAQSYGDDSWENTFRFIYTYSGNHMEKKEDYSFKSGQWSKTMEESWQYEGGKLVYGEQKSGNRVNWKHWYGYNEATGLLERKLSKFLGSGPFAMVYTYTWNNNANTIQHGISGVHTNHSLSSRAKTFTVDLKGRLLHDISHSDISRSMLLQIERSGNNTRTQKIMHLKTHYRD